MQQACLPVGKEGMLGTWLALSRRHLISSTPEQVPLDLVLLWFLQSQPWLQTSMRTLFLVHCSDAFGAAQLSEDSHVFESKYWALNPNVYEHVCL